jgi:hypothetical protein
MKTNYVLKIAAQQMTEGHREQLILERNHVVILVILFSCQRTDFASEGRPICQTPLSVSSEMFPLAIALAKNAFRLTRNPANYVNFEELKRSNFVRCRNRGF